MQSIGENKNSDSIDLRIERKIIESGSCFVSFGVEFQEGILEKMIKTLFPKTI
jgi:hypothetical protein